MHIRLYNGGSLLAPLKCGTRYLDKIFKDDVEGLDIIECERRLFLPKVTDILIRPPFEHLSSALHTTLLTAFNDTERDKTIPVDFESIINRFCYWTKEDIQDTHQRHNIYETLYWIWRRNRNTINVVELKDLTSYLQNLKIKNLIKYNSKDYDFHTYEFWCTKDDVMLFIKMNYPNEWDNLMQQVEDSNVFYNYLINMEAIPIKLL